MNIVSDYLKGLKEALSEFGSEENLNKLKIAEGATVEDIERLKKNYPDCPNAIIDLLRQVNGTYHRRQGHNMISLYILGSDLESYPYYLLSVDQILESSKIDYDFSYLRECYPSGEGMDSKINDVLIAGKYLHFSDCMNNGGSSQLFIDFNPRDEGVTGQVIRYVHDPDECKVIANTFDDYLKLLINNKYAFVY